jgi:hypothetical protein
MIQQEYTISYGISGMLPEPVRRAISNIASGLELGHSSYFYLSEDAIAEEPEGDDATILTWAKAQNPGVTIENLLIKYGW